MRGSAGLVPWLDLDQHDDVPLYLQLYEQVRRAVLSGRLGPGARLPSSRTLATELGLSRATVIQAYDRLWSEGYLEAKVGSGTRVTATLPEERLAAPASARRAPEGRAAVRLARRAEALAPNLAGAGQLDVARPFLPGYPALDFFPLRSGVGSPGAGSARATRSTCCGPPSRPDIPRCAPPSPSTFALPAACAAPPSRWSITTGTQQALARLAALLLDPGDAAWIEDPGYLGARRALLAAGARLVPVPVDDAGIDVDAGMARQRDARLAYVSPSHQFPTGVTMSLERRLRLLQWARDSDAWILEDDYDGEYRYEERPLQALQGMDGSGRVIYMGTFGKILFPSLRLGYAVLPPALVPSFVAARAADDGAPPLLEQLVLTDFLRDEHLARHLRRMRLVYRDRRDALLEALAPRCANMARRPDPPVPAFTSPPHCIGGTIVSSRSAPRSAGSPPSPSPSSPSNPVLPVGWCSVLRAGHRRGSGTRWSCLGACCGDAT